MKKSLYLILLIAMFMIRIVEVDASSGALRKKSIKTCNGITYGQHGGDDHWHQAEADADVSSGWIAVGDPIYSDPCVSNETPTPPPSNDNSSDDSGSNNDNTPTQPPVNDNSNNTTETNDNSSNNNTTTTGSTNTSSNNSVVQNSTPKEESKSSDNTLKSILIDGKELELSNDMLFSTNKENVNIEVKTNDEKATFEIKNNDKLSLGENKVTIDVKSEDGKIKTYTITITRELFLSKDTGIKVMIDDSEVIFTNNKATVTVSSTTKDFKIDYKLSNDKATVEMEEIDELKIGDNKFKIKVIAEDGTEAIYEIIIHKNTKLEDVISTILGFGILGGIGYGIYYLIKKIKK